MEIPFYNNEEIYKLLIILSWGLAELIFDYLWIIGNTLWNYIITG